MSDTRLEADLLVWFDPVVTDNECRAFLAELRWPAGVECLRCGATTVSRLRSRKIFECGRCRYQFSVTTATLFHDSHLSLAKWFLAVLLMSEWKGRLSATQLKRVLKTSYKTAWYLSHRIRSAMLQLNAEQTRLVESLSDEPDDTQPDAATSETESAPDIVRESQSFRQVSAKHHDRYVGEFELKATNRTNPHLFRDVVLHLMQSKALPYRTLTAAHRATP